MPTYDLPRTFDFDDPRVQKTLTAINAKNIRVTAAHVSQSRTLHFIAEWYAARYDGSFAFMRQMRDLITSDRDLSVNQMAGVINCLVHDASKRKPAKVEELPADLPAVVMPRMAGRSNQQVETCAWCGIELAIGDGVYNADGCVCHYRPACRERQRHNVDRDNPDEIARLALTYNRGTITPIVKNGTYTIVLNEAGDYRTLRVESAKNKLEGTQVVGFLSGPNNERDFTEFAWLSGQTIGVWARYRSDSLSMTALEKLVYAGDDKRADMGTAYAIESGRCCRCGRKLTVPASLHRGMGPECASK